MNSLFEEPIEIIDRLSKDGGQEMSYWQSSFLCGLIKKERPQKILEIGVSAGGTTAIILNCLSLIECASKVLVMKYNKA